MSADAPPPSEDGIAFGHFVVPRRPDGSPWELGSGAMGITYRAFDTSLRTEVALKVIAAAKVQQESVRRRFQREARAAAKIRHPNVASVLYLGEQEGEFFYAMEFIEGRNLEGLLKESAGPLPGPVAVGLAAQAAAALNAAHKREVVHRDLKPANLMLLEGDALDHEDDRTDAAGRRQLKIIDFGLARSFGENRDSESLVTQTFEGFIGTPAYASPEQCAGESDLDGRSDLYSLGVILWQMLTGRLPFGGRMAEVIGKHQFQPPPLAQLAGLPAPLADLLAGLLVKDPAQRQPQTAGELRTALDRLLRALESAEAGVPFVFDSATLPAAEADTTHTPPEKSDRTTNAPTQASPEISADYQIEREISRGNGGRLFLALAANDAQGQQRPVAIKFLPPERLNEADFLFRVETALDAASRHPHPVILTHAAGLQHSEESQFYVREWAEGFSLLELLRARGSLRAAEVFSLLNALPGALDLAAEAGFPLLGVSLHKLFAVPAEGDGGDASNGSNPDWINLCAHPVEEWPAFSLKFNPLTFPPPSANEADPTLTRLDARRAHGADLVLALARLMRELMGGTPGSFAPLGALSSGANAVLRRALEPVGGGQSAFADCAAFWAALQTPPADVAAAPVMIAPHASPPLPPLAPRATAVIQPKAASAPKAESAPLPKPAPAPLPKPEEEPPPPAYPYHFRFSRTRAPERRMPWKTLLLAGLAMAGIAFFAHRSRQSDASTAQTDLAAARVAAMAIPEGLNQASTLSRLAVTQFRAGDRDGSGQTLAEAKTAADALKDGRNVALRRIANAQVRTGDFPAAKAAAAVILNGAFKDDVQKRIAIAQAQAGDIAAAKASANAIGQDFQKAVALCGVAVVQARAGVVEGFRQTISEARAVADAVPVYSSKAYALGSIAAAQAEAGNLVEAKATLSAVRDNFALAQSQSQIALAQARAGDAAGARQTIASAQAAADAVPMLPSKNAAQISVTVAQARMGDIAAAKASVAGIKDDSFRAYAWVRIAAAQARAGDLAAAKATAAILDETHKADALGRIAAEQARKEGFASAERWVKTLVDPLERSRAYLALAELRLNPRAQSYDDDGPDEN